MFHISLLILSLYLHAYKKHQHVYTFFDRKSQSFYPDDIDDTELSLEEMKMAVKEAHSKHMTICAHAEGRLGPVLRWASLQA